MPASGQPPRDPSPHEDFTPPVKPWESPWALQKPVPLARPPARRRLTEDEDTPPVTRNFNAAFASRRQQQMRLLLTLSVIAFSLTVLAWIYIRDDEPPWDTDLQTSPAPATTGTARAPDKLRLALGAAKPTPSPELLRKSPWQWDTPSLSHLVAANAAAFDNLRDLAGEDDWQPENPLWKAVDLGSDDHWQALGTAKEAAAAYYARRGQDEIAMAAGLEMIALAKRLQSLDAWPAYYARGVEFHERGCKAIANLLRQSGLDARALGQMQAEFERYAPSGDVLKERLNGFYQFEHRLIAGPRADDPWDKPGASMTADHPSRLFFKPDQTLALFASSLRELKDQVSKSPSAISAQITQRIGPLGRPTGVPFAPNRSGMKYANERIWHYASLLDYLTLQRARHSLVLTLFGVRRYTLDHGKPPRTLEELVPLYFTVLPADPYTGEPPRYDAARGLIYSVGMDFKSDGGRSNDDPLSDDSEPTVMVR